MIILLPTRMACTIVPPRGRRGRPKGSVGDKQPAARPLYIAPIGRLGNGMNTCAPSGAEGATLRERRGQITRGATAIYCAPLARFGCRHERLVL